jgi:uncharacterized membrane protein
LSPALNKTPPTHTSAAPVDGVQSDVASDQAGSPRPRRILMLALAALVVGYAVLSQYSASSPDAKGLGAALSVGPVLLIGLILAWRWFSPLAALLMAAVSCALLYRFWPAVERNFEWADLVQQCGVYALIAASFARSMFAGRVPVCTQLAQAMHGTLTPAEILYTRRATVAWAAFYVLVAVAILVLFFAEPLRVWSLFVNFGVFGLMIVMGVADHALRRRMLPRHPAGGIISIIQRALIG